MSHPIPGESYGKEHSSTYGHVGGKKKKYHHDFNIKSHLTDEKSSIKAGKKNYAKSQALKNKTK